MLLSNILTITYESSFSYLNVWFDKEKMDSILKNILSNSLKYTPENGKGKCFSIRNVMILGK